MDPYVSTESVTAKLAGLTVREHMQLASVFIDEAFGFTRRTPLLMNMNLLILLLHFDNFAFAFVVLSCLVSVPLG
jgi:hypothetical protein